MQAGDRPGAQHDLAAAITAWVASDDDLPDPTELVRAVLEPPGLPDLEGALRAAFEHHRLDPPETLLGVDTSRPVFPVVPKPC